MNKINLIAVIAFLFIFSAACSGEIQPDADIPGTVQAGVEKVVEVQGTVQAEVEKAVNEITNVQPDPTATATASPTQTKSPTPEPTPSPIEFLQSVLDDDLGKANEFILAGVDIDSLVPDSEPTIGGSGALHMAIIKSNKDMVSLLLDNGADPDIRDADMKAPIHVAVIMGNIDIVNLLIDIGANVNATAGNSGATPLDLAYINGSPAIIDRLMGIGAASAFNQVHIESDVKDSPTATPLPTATPDMMAMMGQMMGSMGGNMDMSSMMARMMGQQVDEEPSLQNLMFENLGPWDSSSKTFGDLGSQFLMILGTFTTEVLQINMITLPSNLRLRRMLY